MAKRNARKCETPCPGCRATGKYRFADEVCTDCKNALAEVKHLRAETERHAKNDRVAVGVPEASHWLPYIGKGGREVHGEIQQAIVKLARAVGYLITITVERGAEGYRYKTQESGAEVEEVPLVAGQQQSYPPVYLLPREAHTAIESLYTGIQKLAHNAYQEGHREGRDLLMSMHAGTITLREMEERAGITDKPFDEQRARHRR